MTHQIKIEDFADQEKQLRLIAIHGPDESKSIRAHVSFHSENGPGTVARFVVERDGEEDLVCATLAEAIDAYNGKQMVCQLRRHWRNRET